MFIQLFLYYIIIFITFLLNMIYNLDLLSQHPGVIHYTYVWGIEF